MIVASLLIFFASHRAVELIHQIAASGHVVEIATPAAERLTASPQIPPGAPPLLGFRVLAGRAHHRFGDLDLVLDDAGH
jgi:hypothetical protein